MKTIIFRILVLVAILTSTGAVAQNVLDGAYASEHNITRKPMNYAALREADAPWKKRIWRVINLDEKINLPLKFPEKPLRDRKSLIDCMMDAVNEGSLTAYNPKDDQFLYPMTKEEIKTIGIIGKPIDTTMVTSPDPPYDQIPSITVKSFERVYVNGYKIKEDWHFDRQRSLMDPRILGLGPMMYDRDEKMKVREPATRIVLFWVYFPEVRPLLAQNETFNRFNDSERKTFDDVFIKRIFNSYVVKESNVYDRAIQAYRANGLDALLEASKIKTDMFLWEHDLWEF